MTSANADVEQLDAMDSNIALILLSPAAEMERGNIKASRISARIAAAIPKQASEVVQLACAVEAIEKEDYHQWPKDWLIEGILPAMQQSIIKHCAGDNLTNFQRSRYQELRDLPDALPQLTQGFTPVLLLDDRASFVQTLVDAGARRLKRGDEANAINDHGILHVALSYRHADRDVAGGTVSRETAEEAYEIIANLPLIHKTPRVRVWVDQNLHRYPGHGPWHERGFIPYASLIVISAISASAGFTVGRQRPWIWLETAMALRGGGVHCFKEIGPSIRELICYPDDSPTDMKLFENITQITTETSSIASCIKYLLTSVSLWTPDILEHAKYQHTDDFRKFVLWARMQLIRLREQDTLTLNSRTSEDTMLERLAWMKSLPYLQGGRQMQKTPYLRVEGKIDRYRKNLKLLEVSGKTVLREGVTEVVGGSSGFELFCFKQVGDRVHLDVIPSRSPDHQRQGDSERLALTTQDHETLLSCRGAFSLWDKRFPRGRQPNFVICNTIFDRHYGLYDQIGELGEKVTLGSQEFVCIGFRMFGLRIERVYESVGDNGKRRLCESDVLCIKELGTDGEQDFIEELMSEGVLDSVSRIVKGQTGYPSRIRHPWAIGTSSEKILDTLEKIELKERREELAKEVNVDMISVARARLDEHVYMLTVNDEKYGQVKHIFETSAIEEDMAEDLQDFKISGDLMSCLTKIRLMMGSTEFDPYDLKTLRLGLCVGRVGKDAKPYEQQFELDGSEFRLCRETGCVFSPVNNRKCALSTDAISKAIRVEWLDVYMGSAESEECNITGKAL